jgi:hypothetical protein
MNCHEARAILERLPKDELSAESRAVLEAHLRGCPQCREEQALLNDCWDLLDRFEVPEVPADFTAAVMRRAGASRGRRKAASRWTRREKRDWVALLAVAAALLLAATLWVCRHRSLDRPQNANLPPSSPKQNAAQSPKPVVPQKGATQQTRQDETPANTERLLPDRPTAPVKRPEPLPEQRVIARDAPTRGAIPTIPDAPAKKPVQTAEAAVDRRLIRDLEVYENLELLKNLDLLVDFDVVEKLDDSVL